jgi:CheY-like chemotaxis protein
MGTRVGISGLRTHEGGRERHLCADDKASETEMMGTIAIPRDRTPMARQRCASGSRTRRVRPRGKILVVDDDDAVRDIAAALLREMGYSALEASSGGTALDIIERERKIELMLVDFAMPGMNGAELARQVRSTRTTSPILFMSGFADRTALSGVSDAYLVGKPFIDDELAHKARSVLAGGEMGNVVRFKG